MTIFNPRILWLLLLIIPWLLLLFPLYHYQKRNFIVLGGAIDRIAVFLLSFIKYWCYLIGIYIFIILAWADLAVGSRLVRKNFSGLQVIITMDISNSMRATDILPSRLAASRNLARDVIYALNPAQIGMVFFKGEALVASPLTDDKDFLTGMSANVDPSILTTPGTNLAAGITAAKGLFSASSDVKKVILLLSDGAELSGDLLKSLREVNTQGISIIAVGMGTPQGAQIPSISVSGRSVFSKLESFSLKSAAQATNGLYLTYDTNTTTSIINHLDDYNDIISHLEKEPNRLKNFFILLALALLALSLWFRSTQWKKYFTI
ncbi:MAG: VWA domain-containing protein [Spirochaetia bacterium]